MQYTRHFGAMFVFVAALFLSIGDDTGTCQPAEVTDALPEGALARFTSPTGSIKPIGFTPNGKTLVLRTDSALLLGDIASGKTKTFLSYPVKNLSLSKVRAAALSPDGRTLVTNGYEYVASEGTGKNFTSYWDIATGVKSESFGYSEVEQVIAFSPNGQYLVWDNRMMSLFVRCHGTKPVVKELKLYPTVKPLGGVAFSPDSKLLALLFHQEFNDKGTGYEIHLWQLPKVEKTDVLIAPKERYALGLAFSPDGQTLAAGGYSVSTGGALALWDFKTKKILRAVSRAVYEISWLPDGAALAVRTAAPFNRAALIEVCTGETICMYADGVVQLVVDPRGQLLATGSKTNVTIWDLQAPPGLKVRKNAPLTANEIAALWQDLDAKAAAQGYKALLQLAQGRDAVVNFMAKNLPPAPVKDAEKVQQLIAELDSDVPAQREKATKALKDLGKMVESDLVKALQSKPSAEAEIRLKKLLEDVRNQGRQPGDLRAHRAIFVLERIGSTQARKLLNNLAAGGDWSEQTHSAQAALVRLAKYQDKQPSQ